MNLLLILRIPLKLHTDSSHGGTKDMQLGSRDELCMARSEGWEVMLVLTPLQVE